MELLVGDADFRPKAELEAVREARRGVHIDGGAVHAIGERLGGGIVPSDDRLGMAGAIGVDMADGGIKAVHDFDGQDERVELLVPVLLGGLSRFGQKGACLLIPPHFHPCISQLRAEERQEGSRDIPMHQQRFGTVADGGALNLGIQDDLGSHRKVSVFVHIDVAVARAGLDDRDSRRLDDGLDERGSAARDEAVHVLVQGHQATGGGTVGTLDELYAGRWQANRLKGVLQDTGQGNIGMDGLGSAAQQDGVAGLQAEGGGIHGDIGATLINDTDNAQGNAGLGDLQAVGSTPARQDGPDRVRQGGDLPQPGLHLADARGRQCQPLNQMRRQATLLGPSDVAGVCL